VVGITQVLGGDGVGAGGGVGHRAGGHSPDGDLAGGAPAGGDGHTPVEELDVAGGSARTRGHRGGGGGVGDGLAHHRRVGRGGDRGGGSGLAHYLGQDRRGGG